MIDHKLYFRKAGPPSGTQDIELKWGDNLISFKPRISGVQQVDQVTVRARNRQQTTPFESTTSLQEPDSAIGISRATAAAALSGGHDGRRRPAGALPGGGRRPRRCLCLAHGRRLPRGRRSRQGEPGDQGRIEGEGGRDRHELRRDLRRLFLHAPLPGHTRLPDDLLHVGPLGAESRRPDDAEEQARLGQLRRDGARHEQQRPREHRACPREVPGARRPDRGLVGARRRPERRRLTRSADAASGRRRGRDRLRARRRPPSLRARLHLERQRRLPAATWRSRTAPSRSSPTRRSRCTQKT